MIYSYVLEDSEERVKAREALDEHLTSLNAPARDTWGRLPSQQKAMARAADLAGRQGR